MNQDQKQELETEFQLFLILVQLKLIPIELYLLFSKIRHTTVFFFLEKNNTKISKSKRMNWNMFRGSKDVIIELYHDSWKKRCQNTGINKYLPMF